MKTIKLIMSKRLLIFALIYSFLTYYIIHSNRNRAHGGEIVFLIFPALWIMGLVILLIIYFNDKQITKGILNKILFIFCTPIPTFIFFFGIYIWVEKFESKKTETIYKKNGYTFKVTYYPYLDKTEYRSNFESETGELLLDSVKNYDKLEKKYYTDKFEVWERLYLKEIK